MQLFWGSIVNETELQKYSIYWMIRNTTATKIYILAELMISIASRSLLAKNGYPTSLKLSWRSRRPHNASYHWRIQMWFKLGTSGLTWHRCICVSTFSLPKDVAAWWTLHEAWIWSHPYNSTTTPFLSSYWIRYLYNACQQSMPLGGCDTTTKVGPKLQHAFVNLWIWNWSKTLELDPWARRWCL